MLYVRYRCVVFETSTYCLRISYVLLIVRKNMFCLSKCMLDILCLKYHLSWTADILLLVFTND